MKANPRLVGAFVIGGVEFAGTDYMTEARITVVGAVLSHEVNE